MMRMTFAASIIVSASASGIEAADMRCKNPSREYNATFNEATKRFFVDEYEYKVLAVEKTNGTFVVAGTTMGDGPSFRAEFKPVKKIDFFTKSDLSQTDRCR